MYRGKGNTAGRTERRRTVSTAQQAQFIAESIAARRREGRPYTADEYGLTSERTELLEQVARRLGIIR